MSHLDKAKEALDRQKRFGLSGGPTSGDVLEAIKEIIAHLEQLEHKPGVTVNAPK